MIMCLPQTVASVKDDCGVRLLASHMTLVLTLRWSVLKSFELHLGSVLIRFIVFDWLGTKELAVLLWEKNIFGCLASSSLSFQNQLQIWLKRRKTSSFLFMWAFYLVALRSSCWSLLITIPRNYRDFNDKHVSYGNFHLSRWYFDFL